MRWNWPHLICFGRKQRPLFRSEPQTTHKRAELIAERPSDWAKLAVRRQRCFGSLETVWVSRAMADKICPAWNVSTGAVPRSAVTDSPSLSAGPVTLITHPAPRIRFIKNSSNLRPYLVFSCRRMLIIVNGLNRDNYLTFWQEQIWGENNFDSILTLKVTAKVGVSNRNVLWNVPQCEWRTVVPNTPSHPHVMTVRHSALPWPLTFRPGGETARCLATLI